MFDGSGGDAVQGDSSVYVDVSYKVLVDSYDRYLNRSLYTEMEMFVDVKHTIDVLKDFLAFQESVKDEHSESASLFCNMRYVVADNIPTSMMFGRDVVFFSFITTGDQTMTGDQVEFERYASGLEEIAKGYGGVPHWGKQNYAEYSDLEGFYDLEGINVVREKVSRIKERSDKLGMGGLRE